MAAIHDRRHHRMLGSVVFSVARAPLRMLLIPRLPSWHSYCSMASALFTVSGMANVHGRIHVDGSSTVTDHSSVPGDFGVKRSTMRSVAAFALRYALR